MTIPPDASEGGDSGRWINPYRTRIEQFPGRLFTFASFEEGRRAVTQIVAEASPCICEIGSGSGQHAIELARRTPEARVFGFELRYKRAVRTIEKAEALDVPNVYVLRISGARISDIFQPGSLDAIYVNFPDPWLKLKRRKHRVLSTQFLDQIQPLLSSTGFLSVKTDAREYFEEFLAQAEIHPAFTVSEQSFDLHTSSYAEGNIITEFESLFLKQGLPICYARLEKSDAF